MLYLLKIIIPYLIFNTKAFLVILFNKINFFYYYFENKIFI